MSIYLFIFISNFFSLPLNPGVLPSDSTTIQFHIQQSEKTLKDSPQIAKENAIRAVSLAKKSSSTLLDEALIALGNVYTRLEQPDSTIYYYEEATKILNQQEEVEREAILKYNLGALYFQQGIYLYSISNYEEALKYYQSTYDSVEIAGILLFLGDAYRLSGYNHKAMLNIHRALHLYHSWQDSSRIASCLSVLGTVHLQLGQPDKAIEFYDQVYATRKKAQNIRGIVHTLILMSMITSEPASSNLNKALNLCQHHNLPLLEAFVHDNLAKMYANQEMHDKAIMHNQQSLKIRSSQPNSPPAYQAHTHTKLARSYIQIKKFQEAAKHLSMAKSMLRVRSTHEYLNEDEQIISPEVYIHWLTASGHYWESRAKNEEDLTEALKYYRTAIDFIIQEYIPNTYLQATKLVQLRSHYTLFEKALNIVYKIYQQKNNPYYLQQAYELMGLSKAMLLQQAQLEDAARAQLSLQNDSLLLQEKVLQNRLLEIDKAQRIAQLSQDNDLVSIYQQQQTEVREKYHELIRQLDRKYPDYATYKAQLYPPPLSDIQKYLSENQLLLAYHQGTQDIYTLVINKNSVELLKKTLPQNWNEHFTTFRNALTNFQDIENSFQENRQIIKKEGQYFFSNLMGAIDKDMYNSCDQLLVVPDGVLHYLPFETFLTKSPQNDRFTEFPFLIKEKTVQYGFSIRSFFVNTHHKLVKQTTSSNIFSGFSIDYGGRTNLSVLPSSQQEVDTVAKIMNGKAWKHSTKTLFREEAPNYHVVHYAGHAEVHYENYADHRMIFEEQGEIAESYLYPLEIQQLDFSQTDLMVLSGCHTGDGNLYKGEGIMSLAHAFAMAGCPSLVMSLHEVHDQTSQKVFIPFYEQLKDGLSVSQALRQGKLQYLNSLQNDPFLSHPYFWAGLVSIGQDIALPPSKPLFPEILKILITMAGIIGLLIWAEKITKKRATTVGGS